MFKWLTKSKPEPVVETVLVDYTEASKITGYDVSTINMLVSEGMLTKYDTQNDARFDQSELVKLVDQTVFLEMYGNIAEDLRNLEKKAMDGELQPHLYTTPLGEEDTSNPFGLEIVDD